MDEQQFKLGGKLYPKMTKEEEFKIVNEKYPEYPKIFLLKTDCLRRGVTFSREAIKSLQGKPYNLSICIQFLWHQMEDSGEYEYPWSFYFRDGTGVGVRVSPPENEPYIIDIKDGKYFLCSRDEVMEEIFFPREPEYYNKTTSRGTSMKYTLYFTGFDNFASVSNSHCFYWRDGDECRFCDIVYNAKTQMKLGRPFRTHQNMQDVYETCREALQEKGRWCHMFINGGSDPRDGYDNSFDLNLDIVKALNKAGEEVTGKKQVVPIYLVTEPLTKDEMETLHEAGVGAWGSYLEVWNEEKAKLTTPGKLKWMNREEWLRRTVNAVEIFGRGNVAAGFVIGVEMAPPPYGFIDVDDAVKSTLSGYEYLIKNGIVPLGTNWAIEPGTHFYKMGAIQPPLEFYVKIDLGRYRLLKEFGEGISADYLCYKTQIWSCYGDFQRLL